MVRHSMKILALSAVLSKKHWSKKFFVLFEAKAILVLLRIKTEKSFVIHVPYLKRLLLF